MSISKIKQVTLETTADYQPISNLNVRFFNQDVNTSVFDFFITRDNHPVPLGQSNVEGSIVLKSKKFQIEDKVKIKDALNGIVTYTLPKEILERSGKVTGQIYIAVKGREDTVVSRFFSFNIENDLATSFDAETKLIYIRTFDQLEEQISQRVESIEEAIEHSEDYVTKIVEEKDEALEEIDSKRLELINKIEEEKSNLKSIVDEYTENFEQVDKELNQKIEGIKDSINPETYVAHTQSDKWQKHKLTNDNGEVLTLNNLDFDKIHQDLKSGLYWVTNAQNSPSEYDGYLTVKKWSDSNVHMKVIFEPFNNNEMFLRTLKDDKWLDWKEVTIPIKSENIESIEGSQSKANKALADAKVYIDENTFDTGWQPLPIISNLSKHDSAGASVYRVINNICEIRFNIGIDRWSDEMPLIQPPANASPSSGFSFLARTNMHVGKNPAIISYDTNKGYFKIWNNAEKTMKTGDYVYGHVVYMVGGSWNV